MLGLALKAMTYLPMIGKLAERLVTKRIDADVKRSEHRLYAMNAIQDNEAAMAGISSRIVAADRKSPATSWIRPAFAFVTLVFWVTLAGSQMEYVEDSDLLLPLIFHVPPSILGQFFLALPMGIVMTFTIGRPFEKRAMMGFLK